MICLDTSCRVATCYGSRSASTLSSGDQLETFDTEAASVAWVGRANLKLQDGTLSHGMQPILIRKGAFGLNLPEKDILVSPQQRVLLTGTIARQLFSSPEVLIAARHLVGLPGIEHWVASEVTYVQISCSNSQIVKCNGLWLEFFQTTDTGHAATCADQRAEIAAVFPAMNAPEAAFKVTTPSPARRDRYEAELVALH